MIKLSRQNSEVTLHSKWISPLGQYMFPSKWRHTGWCCCCTLSHQTDHAFVIKWHIQTKAWPTGILTGGHLKGDNLPPVIAQRLAGTPILTGWKWIYQSQFWFYLHVRAAPAQPSQSSSWSCHQWWNKLPPKVRKAESLPIFLKRLKPYLFEEYLKKLSRLPATDAQRSGPKTC